AIGSKYLSPVVIAKDMVSPELKSFTMTVEKPDGSYYVIDGTELNGVSVRQVEIDLDSYGAYSFTYRATDWANRSFSFNYQVNVFDTVAPTVKTQGSYAVTGEKGKAVTIATFTAIDNVDKAEDLTVRILVLDTSHNFSVVTTGKFTPEKAGKYTVYCYVTDSFGNVGLCYYNVEVK
ncbi:MAG: hypothetical protein J6Y43_04940, partial [Clostridia bacterium]|nr:hypothetical protein [Clostridia bacterium]